MGKRGPQPKPDQLKALEGNPGKRPINKEAPIADGRPECPPQVGEYGRLVWERVINSMPDRLYGTADTEMLAAYCVAAERHRDACVEISQNKYDGEGDRPSKWFPVMAQQATLIMQLGGKLGLDPVSRSSINMAPEKSVSKFGSLMAINGGRRT